MATPRVTIPELPAQAAIVDTDLLVVQNGATTKKMTIGTLTTPPTTALNAHINNPTDAHDASAVSATANTAPLTGTNVQLQLAQAGTEIAAVKTAATTVTTGLADHLAGTVDAHDASAISFIPAGTVGATQVQAAIEEVASEAASNLATLNTNLNAHLADALDAHDASAISCLPSGNLNSSDVQAALTELQTSIDDVTTTGISGKVDKTTTINTIAPLIGGGDLSVSRTLGIDVFTPTVKGAVPEPGTPTGRYLKDDATWGTPAGGGGGASAAVDVTYAGSTNLSSTNVEAALDELDTEKQPASAVLTDWATKYTVATATVPSSLKLVEATNNGVNTTTLTGLATVASDNTITFPGTNGTVVLVANTATLSNKTMDGASNTFTNIPASAVVRTVITQATVGTTAALTDANAYIAFTGTNPTYTIPPNSTVAFPVGTQIDGTGTATAMTLIQGAGVTIVKARTLVTVGAGSGWTAIKVATDTWHLHGDCV